MTNGELKQEILRALAELVEHCPDVRFGQLIANLGADRLVFGTGMPFNYPDPALLNLEVLDVSKEDKEKIAWRNAERWLLVESGRGEADFNMAMDEALLEGSLRLQRPVLRFYGWTAPAASFGYFQKYSSVERATLLRPLLAVRIRTSWRPGPSPGGRRQLAW